MWVFIVPLVVGIGSGFSIGRYASSAQDNSEDLKSEIARLQEEPSGYKQQVWQHFVETSELINAMSANYRDLYAHLSKASQDLGGKHAASDMPDSVLRFVEHSADNDAKRRATGYTDAAADGTKTADAVEISPEPNVVRETTPPSPSIIADSMEKSDRSYVDSGHRNEATNDDKLDSAPEGSAAEVFGGDNQATEDLLSDSSDHEAEPADQVGGEPPEERGKNDNAHQA